MSNVIKLYSDNNHTKCEAIKKLGYNVENYGNTYLITSKKIKNLDQFIDVYYRSINEILFTFQNDLKRIGYTIAA